MELHASQQAAVGLSDVVLAEVNASAARALRGECAMLARADSSLLYGRIGWCVRTDDDVRALSVVPCSECR